MALTSLYQHPLTLRRLHSDTAMPNNNVGNYGSAGFNGL